MTSIDINDIEIPHGYKMIIDVNTQARVTLERISDGDFVAGTGKNVAQAYLRAVTGLHWMTIEIEGAVYNDK